CILQTGGGKTALYAIPTLCHLEISQNPLEYPEFAGIVRENPVGLVVTPTKGLASNIVLELGLLGIPAFAYTHKNITEIRKDRQRDLVREIIECKTWNVICVDPEHFQDDEWRKLTIDDTFQSNLIYNCIEEGHLMRDWASFRPMYKTVGSYTRGRLLHHSSIFLITATLQPGDDSRGLSLHVTSHGLNGYEFPDLLPYINSGQKTIIHCATMELVYRVFVYLWSLEPDSVDHLRRVRMYHSLCSDEYNEDTIRRLNDDPYCQFVISTVAFANGINARRLVLSVSIG
ncbi:hypothetical protein BDZ89DRAFT_923025, partial [Hymenopellis radicata]